MTNKADVVAHLDSLRDQLAHCDVPEETLEAISQAVEGMLHLLPPFPPQYRLLQLKGLGKEIWQDVDVQDYLREERASWR